MKKIFALLSTAVLTCSVAFAHVSNEYTIYDDTQYSEAKDELVQLRTLGVIPYTHGASIYGPQDILKKEELGYWTAQFFGKDDKKNEKDYVKEAIDMKLIDTDKGNATYTDVLTAYFGNGALKDKEMQEAIKGKEKKEITKEDFAILLGKFVDLDGKDNLLLKSGYQAGPKGKVESVITKEVKEGDTTFNTYQLVIGGVTYPVSHHPKILFGPVELEKWIGKEVETTWVLKAHPDENVEKEKGKKIKLTHGNEKHDEKAVQATVDTKKKDEKASNVSDLSIEFIQAKEGQFKTSEYAPIQKEGQKKDENKTENEKDEKGFPWALTIGGVIVVGLLGFVFASRRRS